jgi:subtilase family serine protease
VTDATTRRTVGLSQAVHELLVRAAIQGQTVFAAAGDSGAYDVNGDLGCDGPYSSAQPNSTCSLALTVDYPASDPAITAAGGTTLPGTQEFCLNAACTPPYFTVSVAHERVWAWDYLFAYAEAASGCNTPISCGVFPVGGGGGVSTFFKTPFYQDGLPGIQRSQPNQTFEAGEDFIAEIGIVDLYYPLPSYYPGRNVPDVSFNADPYTGYAVYYTSDQTGFGVQAGWGGTSFVGPQLNGVSALLGQYVHGRIGLLNYPLYGLASRGQAYSGHNPPLHAIAYGDNWFYKGSKGYNPGTGLGTIDVSDFAEALRDLF